LPRLPASGSSAEEPEYLQAAVVRPRATIRSEPTLARSSTVRLHWAGRTAVLLSAQRDEYDFFTYLKEDSMVSKTAAKLAAGASLALCAGMFVPGIASAKAALPDQ